MKINPDSFWKNRNAIPKIAGSIRNIIQLGLSRILKIPDKINVWNKAIPRLNRSRMGSIPRDISNMDYVFHKCNHIQDNRL